MYSIVTAHLCSFNYIPWFYLKILLYLNIIMIHTLRIIVCVMWFPFMHWIDLLQTVQMLDWWSNNCYFSLLTLLLPPFSLMDLIFSLWTAIISLLLSNILTPLWSASFSPLAFTPFRSDLIYSFPSALPAPLWSLRLYSAKLWSILSRPSLLDPIWTSRSDWLGSVWLSSLSSALSFAPLDLLIPLKITYR